MWSPETPGMIVTPGRLCETWNERNRAGEEDSKTIPFPGWLEREEGALGEEGSVPLAPLVSKHRAGGSRVVPRLLCLGRAPTRCSKALSMPSDTVPHPFICFFFFLAGFLGLEQSISPLSFSRPFFFLGQPKDRLKVSPRGRAPGCILGKQQHGHPRTSHAALPFLRPRGLFPNWKAQPDGQMAESLL